MPNELRSHDDLCIMYIRNIERSSLENSVYELNMSFIQVNV